MQTTPAVSQKPSRRFGLWWGLLLPLLTSCGDFGKVEQGRVVAFDAAQQTVTMIVDLSPQRGKPDYSGVPARSFKLPEDPSERGALPKVGPLLQLQLEPPTLLVWSAEQQQVLRFPVEQVAAEQEVDSRSPLVYDRDARKPFSFPQLDVEKGELKFYLPAEQRLLTLRLPEEARALPPSTWTYGDEVRIYFKDPQLALRYMNVTRTDIYAK